MTDAAVADAAVEPTELPSHCSLSFEIGDCLAAHLAYWHDPELRTCVSMIYSGCGGNDNRFETREACIASCPPPASNADCESPRVQTSICIGCGPLGGCGEEAVACALPCGSHGDCVDEAGLVCVDSFCQVGGCI